MKMGEGELQILQAEERMADENASALGLAASFLHLVEGEDEVVLLSDLREGETRVERRGETNVDGQANFDLRVKANALALARGSDQSRGLKEALGEEIAVEDPQALGVIEEGVGVLKKE